jgi:hypothetical protein
MSEFQSDTIGKLAEALAKAKGEFKKIIKETDNPAYLRGGKAMKYADLSTIIEATEGALAANGLSIIQSPDVNVVDHSMSLTGMLVHSSGEWMRFITTLPAVQRERFDAQSCGSAITYARRYQYKSLIGAAEEDDDANLASGIGTKEAAKAVGEQKVADLKAKAKDYVPALFYTWFNESQTARIEGDSDLMTTHRELLKKYYHPAVKAVVVNAEQLEDLKYHFEKIAVPFKLLKSVGENLQGQLEESIKELNKKKASNGQPNA